MPTRNFLVGFYTLPGVAQQVIVETPLTGTGANDYRNLTAEVQKLYPDIATNLYQRIGSVIEARDPEEREEWINPNPGMTLRQIFPTDDKGVEEYSRMVGSVFFGGSSCKVSLRYYPERSKIKLVLIDRLTKQSTRFTEEFDGSLLLKDLPALLTEAIGSTGKDLRLRVKSHKSDADQAAKERVPDLKNQIPRP